MSRSRQQAADRGEVVAGAAGAERFSDDHRGIKFHTSRNCGGWRCASVSNSSISSIEWKSSSRPRVVPAAEAAVRQLAVNIFAGSVG
jgi:hypothetical protein